MPHALVEYSFSDQGEDRALSKAARAALRTTLRSQGFSDRARASWEKRGEQAELVVVLGEALRVLDARLKAKS